MAGSVILAGHAASAASGTTLVIPVTVPTAAGDTLAVWATAGAGAVTGVSDSENTTSYTQAVTVSQGALSGSWWVLQNAGRALSASDTVTVTYSVASANKTGELHDGKGVQSVSLDTVTTVATGNSAAPLITSNTLTQAAEIVLCGQAGANAGGAVSWVQPAVPAGKIAPMAFTGLGSDHAGQWAASSYLLTGTTAGQTAAGTLASPVNWLMATISLLVQPVSGRHGAELDPSGGGVGSWDSYTSAWSSGVWQVQTRKIYLNHSYPVTLSPVMQSCINQNVPGLLCYNTAVPTGPADYAALEASIAALIAAGLPVQGICLFAEANGGRAVTAAQYLAVMSYTVPRLRASFPGIPIVYNPESAQDTQAAAYFPGPPNLPGVLIDYMLVDIYGSGYDSGKDLTLFSPLANGNTAYQGGQLYPPIPMGIGEFANSATAVAPSTAQVTTFIQYITSVFSTTTTAYPLIGTVKGRLAQGLANAEINWFQGNLNVPGLTQNVITLPAPGSPSSDYRLPLLYGSGGLWQLTTVNAPGPPPPPPPPPTLAQPLQVPFFPPGYGPGPTDFNGWIQAPTQFLTAKVVFRASLASTPTTFANGQNTQIVYDQINEDPYSGWSAAAGAWRCPPGMSGTYEITLTAAAQAATGATTTMQANIAQNGTITWTCSSIWMPTSQIGIASGSVQLQLAGGQDRVSGYAWWNGTSSGTASLLPGRRCTIEITWICL